MEIARGLLKFQRQDNHVQHVVVGGEGHQLRPAASGKSIKKPDWPLGHGHYRGGVGDLRGLLGQVQEDDRLDRFGGGQGRVVGMLHEAAQYAHGQDAWSGRLVIL